MRPRYATSSPRECLQCMGAVYEQGSEQCRPGQSKRSYICANLQQLHRADQLQGYGMYSPCVTRYSMSNFIQIFVVLLVTVCIVANNLAFGMFRSSKPSTMPTAQPYYPPTPGQNFQWGAPPQTPQHNIGYEQWGGQTFQAIMPSHTPSHRSPSKGSRSPSKGNRSPSKGEMY